MKHTYTINRDAIRYIAHIIESNYRVNFDQDSSEFCIAGIVHKATHGEDQPVPDSFVDDAADYFGICTEDEDVDYIFDGMPDAVNRTERDNINYWKPSADDAATMLRRFASTGVVAWKDESINDMDGLYYYARSYTAPDGDYVVLRTNHKKMMKRIRAEEGMTELPSMGVDKQYYK